MANVLWTSDKWSVMYLYQAVVHINKLNLQTDPNVFISSLASCIQAPIYRVGGNAFWWQFRSLSETYAVGRPAVLQERSQIITVSQKATGMARCWVPLRHYFLTPVFSSWLWTISKWLCGNHTPCQKVFHFCLRNSVSAKVCHLSTRGRIHTSEDRLSETLMCFSNYTYWHFN